MGFTGAENREWGECGRVIGAKIWDREATTILLHVAYSLFFFFMFLHYLGKVIGWCVYGMVHWTAQEESGWGSAYAADPFITDPAEGLGSDNV